MLETPNVTYSFLGPVGTFTEAALAQVPEAQGKPWRAVNNVGEALADVLTGRSVAAMIAIENSVDGGVSATQDALAGSPDLRIIGEYLVPVNFVLVARPGTTLAEVKVINAHPVAYAQCRIWLESTLPHHGHIPASSNVASSGIPVREHAGGCRHRPARDREAPRPRRARHGHRRQPQRGHPVRAGQPHDDAPGPDRRRQDEPDRRTARGPLRRAARDARAVRHPRSEPQPDPVPPDRRRPRPGTAS